jgi:hypothetical protein
MKVIVWDVDDVLNDLMGAWLGDWTEAGSGVAGTAYEKLTDNPPHDLLGISRAAYLESLDAFRLGGKAAGLAPEPEVHEWFCRQGQTCRHVALTAVPLRTAHVSAEWVMRNFGRWIRSFNVAPSARPGDGAQGSRETKADFLRWWGKGDILVDDREENIAGARSMGMCGVLFPRPWNHCSRTIRETLEELTGLI